MAKQTINIGTTANDGTGDAIRAAFGKVNDNFTEIYTANTGTNTGDQNLSAYATTAAVAAGYQPLDSDLTAISALTTTAYGRALLSTADAATLRSAIGVGTTDAPTFLAQTLTGQSLTGTQATSLVDLSATWNTTGTPSALKLNVTDTASNAASKLMDLQVGGVSKFNVDKGGQFSAGGGNFNTTSTRVASTLPIALGGNGYIGFGPFFNPDSTALDAILIRDAPGILAQRNGVNAQAFRVYNTYTDASNYSRLKIGWDSATYTAFTIEGQQLGTGGGRNLALIGGGNVFGLGVTPSTAFNWVINAGHLLAGADNAFDIGATTANRPANINAASSVRGEYFSMTSGLTGVTRSYLVSPSAGVVTLFNSAGNDFNRIQLGGTTSAFPAIKRNGTGIDIRLADDTAFAPLSAGAVTATNLVTGNGLGGSSGLTFASQLRIMSSSDGVMYVSNNGFTDFNRFQLGSTADTHPAIARDGAGIKITGAAAGSTSWIKVPAVAVSALPLAATAGVGARSFVNDALAPTFGSAVTGGGAVTVPVYSTGSAWNVG